MIRIAVIEDEEKEYKKLKSYIDRFADEYKEVFEISYFSGAVDFISDYNYSYDLVFMDIIMPDINGIEAAQRLRKVDKDVTLIFLTNMAQYAIQGYDVAARYFLLKPLEYKDFELKMQNTVNYIKKLKSYDFIMLNLPYEKRKVIIKDIKYLEVFSHDVVFHLTEGDLHVRGTLSEFEKKLGSRRFCRVNSCYIVNLDYVTSIRDMSVFIDDNELRISYARKKILMKALADYVAKGV